MDQFKLKSASRLLFFVFILLSPAILIYTTFADYVSGQSEQDKRQSFVEIVQDIISLVERTRFGSWDKVKSAVHQMQSRVFPLNLDFRSADESQARGGGGDGVGGKMKEAAEKSFGASQVAIEETAKSAAIVVGEVVQQTTEKVK